MGTASRSLKTHAPSQSESTGQTRPQLMPRIFASRMSFALPRMLPDAIFLMNAGMSMCVGQARVHGASKQNRQRLASTLALWGANGGLMSAKFFSYSASDNFGARFLIMSFSVYRDPSGRGSQAPCACQRIIWTPLQRSNAKIPANGRARRHVANWNGRADVVSSAGRIT